MFSKLFSWCNIGYYTGDFLKLLCRLFNKVQVRALPQTPPQVADEVDCMMA